MPQTPSGDVAPPPYRASMTIPGTDDRDAVVYDAFMRDYKMMGALGVGCVGGEISTIRPGAAEDATCTYNVMCG
jgi:hypothetical protein